MRLKKGVSVPMDIDAINPDSLQAAFTMGVQTLFDRATAAGDTLDWSTIEMALQPSPVETDACTLMVVRAAALL